MIDQPRPDNARATTLCVILHYGSEEDTWRCVESLKDDPITYLVVSDNDPDQSLVAPEHLTDYVRIVRTGGRAGFAEGNNIAVLAASNEQHDSILILNNDTIVEAGAVQLLRKVLEDPGVGAVGPCMPFVQRPNEIWACGGTIDRLRLQIRGIRSCESNEPGEVDYLPGAAILCRRDVWERLGGLPDRYFLAFEEAEFALEIKRLGFSVMVQPISRILHRVGMSSAVSPMYFYNSIRNRIRFGQYLYGPSMGFVWGSIVTAKTIAEGGWSAAGIRLRIWVRALREELLRVPLGRNELDAVAETFPGRI